MLTLSFLRHCVSRAKCTLPRSSPKPEMHIDDRSNDQILADIVRTCFLQLTESEKDVHKKMIGKSVVFPESLRQETYRVPKTLLDSALKDLSMSKTQAESLHRDIDQLPHFVDMYDPPTSDIEPLDPELTQLTRHGTNGVA